MLDYSPQCLEPANPVCSVIMVVVSLFYFFMKGTGVLRLVLTLFLNIF